MEGIPRWRRRPLRSSDAWSASIYAAITMKLRQNPREVLHAKIGIGGIRLVGLTRRSLLLFYFIFSLPFPPLKRCLVGTKSRIIYDIQVDGVHSRK